MKKVSSNPPEIDNKQSAFGTQQSAESPQFKKQITLSFAIILLLFTFFTSLVAFAQNPDEEKQQNVQETEDAIEEDTTDEGLTSDFTIRIDYLSKVLSAGRDFGISQYGISPSLAYYHKSGLFVNLTGNMYSQSEPKYAMTDLSVGYSNVFNFAQSWSYSVSYDRYFFNPDSGGLLKNSFGLYTNYDFGPLNAGVSYSFIFSGEETAHRINPGINGYFIMRKVGFIDKISFSPGISATIATDNIPFSRFNQEQFEQYYSSTAGNALAERILRRKNPILYQQYLKEKQTNSTLTVRTFTQEKGIRFQAPNQTQEKKVFGLMSWNFTLPVRLKVKNLGFGITYNYVIPILLPDESYTTEVSNQSYISANINYTFSK